MLYYAHMSSFFELELHPQVATPTRCNIYKVYTIPKKVRLIIILAGFYFSIFLSFLGCCWQLFFFLTVIMFGVLFQTVGNKTRELCAR